MASTYSDLKIELIGTGEQVGTWGSTTNTNLGTALEEAIVGSADVAFSSADVTLTLTNTNGTQPARHLRLNLTGTSGGARNLILGSGCQIDKPYIIANGLADTVTVKNTTGTGVAVPAGKTMWVYNNGTNVVEAMNHAASLTLGSALPVASGGTGQTSYTDGQLLIGNTTGNTLTKTTLTAGTGIAVTNGSGSITVAALNNGTVTSVSGTGTVQGLTLSGTVTSSGNLTLGGSLSAVNLTSQVTGTLPVANGGTGATTLTGVVKGTGTSALTAGSVNLTSEVTGALPVANGGTGATSAANARTNLGLGSLATANTISNDNWSGTDLAVVNGGTGASDAGTARTNLGLGTIATQNSNSVSITGGSITGITDLAVADGGTGASTSSGARTNLGLGTIATLNTINNDNWSGTDLAVANGGTGASDAGTARTNLGLGSMSTQNSNNVTITGGSIQGVGLVAASSQASTSGTSIDFTGVPSWVKRIQVLFYRVSKNGSSNCIVRLGTSGGFATSGYESTTGYGGNSGQFGNATDGLLVTGPNNSEASGFISGIITICKVTGNSWVSSYAGGLYYSTGLQQVGGGSVTLGGTLDRVRVTSQNGTDLFDSGSINIIYD